MSKFRWSVNELHTSILCFSIVFTVIEQVLKKNHRINGTAIEVCRYVPPPPLKPVPVYSNKVLITNINEKTTKDGLENFLEAKTNITPVSIEYGELKGTVLITFEEDIGELESVSLYVLSRLPSSVISLRFSLLFRWVVSLVDLY